MDRVTTPGPYLIGVRNVSFRIRGNSKIPGKASYGLSEVYDDIANQLLELDSNTVSSLLDFLVGQGLVGHAGAHIGDAGDAADFHTDVVCSNCLASGRHTDCMGTEVLVCADFCRRFVSGAGGLQVDTFLNLNAVLVSLPDKDLEMWTG